MTKKIRQKDYIGLRCIKCGIGEMEVPKDNHSSYVFCPVCNAIELTYLPQPLQAKFHKSPSKYKGFFGGFGSGKSFTSANEGLQQALRNPNSTGLVGTNTLVQLKKTAMETYFNEVIPPPLIENFHKQDSILTLINNHKIIFTGFEDEEYLRSLNLGWFHIEESSTVKYDIFLQLQGRLRNIFQKRHIGFVSSNPDRDWNYHKFIINPNPDYDFVIAPTSSNPYLPDGFEKSLRESYPDWWIQRYLDGDFTSFNGQIYTELALKEKGKLPLAVMDANEFERLNPEWEKNFERVYAIDHGFINPTAIIELSIDKKRGKVYQTWEHYEANQTPNYHAKKLLARMENVPLGKIHIIVIDPSAKNTKQYGELSTRNVVDLYNDEGVYPEPANNHVQAGILKISQWLKLGHLTILNNQEHTIAEAQDYQWKEQDINKPANAEEKPVKNDDHLMDALRYGIMALPAEPNELINQSYDSHSEYLKVRQFLDEDDLPFALRSENNSNGGVTSWHDWY